MVKSSKIERICERCRNTFMAYPSSVKYHRARFCSRDCKNEFNRGSNSFCWKEKPIRICQNCNKEYAIEAWRLKEPTRGKFCTQKCQAAYRVGENAANWRGGITPESKRIRSRKDILEWRRRVLIRDKYRCVWCLSTDDLEVDHIKPFSSHPELRAVTSNGRVLCRPCHIKTFTKATA